MLSPCSCCSPVPTLDSLEDVAVRATFCSSSSVPSPFYPKLQVLSVGLPLSPPLVLLLLSLPPPLLLARGQSGKVPYSPREVAPRWIRSCVYAMGARSGGITAALGPRALHLRRHGTGRSWRTQLKARVRVARECAAAGAAMASQRVVSATQPTGGEYL